jgi:hypothetical protein
MCIVSQIGSSPPFFFFLPYSLWWAQHSFLYRKYITHIHLLYFVLLPFHPISALPSAWPVSHSCPSLFRCRVILQWDFCLDIIPVLALCLSLTSLHYTFLPLSPILCCSTVFSMFLCVLFLHRCDVLHYYSLSFFPSFPPPFVSSTSSTFGYMIYREVGR